MATLDPELDEGRPRSDDAATGKSTLRPARGGLRPLARWLRKGVAGIRRFLDITIFSSLTRRIVVLNMAGLLVLVVGILYLNQWRAGLIDARVQSLRVQGEIIAAAIAASATVDSDVISVNPDRLLELQAGNVSPLSYFDPTLEFPISPERVAPLLRNLITPTRTRARIYDQQGLLILDSENIYARGEVLRKTIDTSQNGSFFLVDWWNAFMAWSPGDNYPKYQEYEANEGTRYPEVASALQGAPADFVRVDAQNHLVVSVAVPVQRLRAIVGVILLSTAPGDIDSVVTQERWSILRIALIAAAVQIALSLLLAGTIAGPMRRLSAAAERVQTAGNARAEIPDLTYRPDEIGHLSYALRRMTDALYNRIEAIERFAADVAHELKNPLTSLRSAVETLPLAKKPEDRERLNAIIQHDVKRLDRLITDISSASRLDAELARESAEAVDVEKLAEAMVAIQRDVAAGRDVNVVMGKRLGKGSTTISGHESRLAQVFANLIDNAVSFSPPGGTVSVAVSTEGDTMQVTVTDEGPGITGDVTRIFQRFYTDRPETESFGNHSGLGLSISKQIVDAHKGTIRAHNRTDRSGAVFTIVLPKARK
ncbi:sensor histidine kinase [Devosia sp. 63-57]|uniref:sensor histidine kinase n=1 Tax=Devosia sp. 63-57 TaxID=1895751 RepID=UPI00086B731B|nr:sensor histidine kinase [Devosia sp. 63-57]ODT48219.1 MAG: histidine kinase [Pelagibacterium sp. SCN 63-126]ODU84263.1 MAG: histidine kinase [Pelagibacterium sp. SCN 63-17]OJX42070.1 MAG: histidine kinase [Devosia sp. 63-57]